MEINVRSLVLGGAIVAGLKAAYSFKATPVQTAYTWRQFSTVESVIPGGMGRSRVIISDEGEQMIEKDLLNFYSVVGINFKNIANNDRLIVDNINQWTNEGWELVQATTGVQSTEGSGIFITRYLFRKPV